MSEILGTIKVLEGRIITTKNGISEIWSRGGGDTTTKKKYEEIEDDIDLDIDDEDLY